MNLKTHRKLVSVSCILFALLTFANTNGENQEGSSRTRNRSKRQINIDKPRNCHDVENRETISGVYRIYPGDFHDVGVDAYCDLQNDGGGWTVFLQRNLQTRQLNFIKTFDQYAQGFGNANGEYWLGNRYLHAITYKDFTLMVKAKNLKDEVRTAEWSYFKVGPEKTKFTLLISQYNTTSTLGDGLTNAGDSGRLSSASRPFSTVDQINGGTPSRCLSHFGRGGWWYNNCLGVNPTAPLSSIAWVYWNKGSGTSPEDLSEIQFKIRPYQS